MKYKYSKQSKKNLKTCHIKLQRVMNKVIKYIDCTIVCGYRGKKAQNKVYLNGYSNKKFPKSKHNKRPSHAVDVIPYPTGYTDLWMFYELMDIITEEAFKLNIKLKWGRWWKNQDYPHWELIRRKKGNNNDI